MALLYASRGLDSLKEKLTNFDQQVGVQIVQSALKVPLKTIADNAGAPPPPDWCSASAPATAPSSDPACHHPAPCRQQLGRAQGKGRVHS